MGKEDTELRMSGEVGERVGMVRVGRKRERELGGRRERERERE